MNGINLEKHFALISSKLVQEIFNPLLNSIGITYFNYIKRLFLRTKAIP